MLRASKFNRCFTQAANRLKHQKGKYRMSQSKEKVNAKNKPIANKAVTSARTVKENKIPADVLAWIDAGNPVFAVHSTDVNGKCTCGKSTCNTPGKHPVYDFSPNGNLSATKDLLQVARWFEQMPLVSIAMTLENLLVIDVDRHGVDGFITFNKWHSISKWTDETRIHGTPGNGKHLFFKKPSGKYARGTSILGPGLDVLSGASDKVIIHGCRNGKAYTIESPWNQSDLPKFPECDQLKLLRLLERTGLKTAFKDPVSSGSRHSNFVSLGGKLRNNRLKDPDLEFILRMYNDIIIEPPFSEREIEKEIEAIKKLKANNKETTGKSIDALPSSDQRILFDTYATDYEIEKAVCEKLNEYNKLHIEKYKLPAFYLSEQGNVLNIRSNKNDGYNQHETSGAKQIPELETLYKSLWHAYRGTEDTGYKPYRYVNTNHMTIRCQCQAYAVPVDDVFKHPVVIFDKQKFKILSEKGYYPDSKIMVNTPSISLTDYKADLDGYDAIEQAEKAKDKALRAVESILQLVSENEFQTEAHRVRFLMAFLTPLLMPVVHKAPLVLLEASTQGSGKSTLANIIKHVYNKSGIPDLNFGGDSVIDEQKRQDQLTSLFSHNVFSVGLIDNVTATVSSDALTKILSEGYHSGRPLYTAKQLQFKNRALWILTSNNTKCHPDFFRRSLIVRLVPSTARPELTQYRIADIIGHVDANRNKYLCDALEIINAWIQAGALESDHALGTFNRWSKILLGIVEYLGIYSGDTRDLLPTDAEREKLSDDRTDAFTGLISQIYNHYKSVPLTAKQWYEFFHNVDDSNRDILSANFPSVLSISRAMGSHEDKVFRLDSGISIKLVYSGKNSARIQTFSLQTM